MLHAAHRPLIGIITALAVILVACGGGGQGELLLATTTSVNDSGLLDDLVPRFEEESGVNVKVIAVGTGAALRMAALGNADALLVHSPEAERELVSSGDIMNRRLVAYNDFLVVGPSGDPAQLRAEPNLEVGLERLLAAGQAGGTRFLSRGDDSGTHKRELALWAAAGLDPRGDWYLESGQGMGATLTIADQRGAYLLTDRATFLALRHTLELVPLLEQDPLLINLYSVMQVNPQKSEINGEEAAAWVDFMTRPDMQSRIGLFRVEEFGQPLFHIRRE